MIGSGIRTGITPTTHRPAEGGEEDRAWEHVFPSVLPPSLLLPGRPACKPLPACGPSKFSQCSSGTVVASSPLQHFFHSFNLRSPSSSLSSFLPSVKSPWGKICCLRILIGLFSRRVVSSIAFGICSKFAHLSETQSIRPLKSRATNFFPLQSSLPFVPSSPTMILPQLFLCR